MILFTCGDNIYHCDDVADVHVIVFVYVGVCISCGAGDLIDDCHDITNINFAVLVYVAFLCHDFFLALEGDVETVVPAFI